MRSLPGRLSAFFDRMVLAMTGPPAGKVVASPGRRFESPAVGAAYP
jgi:hypothetical protein